MCSTLVELVNSSPTGVFIFFLVSFSLFIVSFAVFESQMHDSEFFEENKDDVMATWSFGVSKQTVALRAL